jgi:putative membrane protein
METNKNEGLPKWIRPYLKPQDLDQIKKTIREEEKGMSGEIIPVVVRGSSAIGHMPLLLFLLLGFLVFFFDLPGWQERVFSLSSLPLGAVFWWQIIDLSLVLLLVRFLAPRPWIQRWLTPKDDQIHQVEARAELEFFASKVFETEKNTGIMIFLSLMERRVVVLADQKILKRCPSETWQEVIDRITQAVHEKNLASGLQEGIRICASILKEELAQDPEAYVNELPNDLIIKE